ncbi:MAG: hypothetical protein KGH98_01340, partial [Candidatus Micrarchaeota archaeon]|nr:hypothetical protein [Candidatus Micrarchaeota archaeon]
MNRFTDDLKFIAHRPRQTAKRLLNIRDELSYLTILREVFVYQAYRWLVEDLKPGTTALDIGAFRGESAIYFAMHDKIRRVIAVDPSYQAYAIARTYIRESGLAGKIKLINNAVTKD